MRRAISIAPARVAYGCSLRRESTWARSSRRRRRPTATGATTARRCISRRARDSTASSWPPPGCGLFISDGSNDETKIVPENNVGRSDRERRRPENAASYTTARGSRRGSCQGKGDAAQFPDTVPAGGEQTARLYRCEDAETQVGSAGRSAEWSKLPFPAHFRD